MKKVNKRKDDTVKIRAGKLCELFKISRWTLKRMIEDKRLPALILEDIEELERYIVKQSFMQKIKDEIGGDGFELINRAIGKDILKLLEEALEDAKERIGILE